MLSEQKALQMQFQKKNAFKLVIVLVGREYCIMPTQRDSQSNEDNKDAKKEMKTKYPRKHYFIIAATTIIAIAMVAGTLALIFTGEFQVITMIIAAAFS